MDNNRKIPVNDVKQITYEMALIAIDMKKNASSNVDFKKEFDKMVDDRIGMVLKTIDKQKEDE